MGMLSCPGDPPPTPATGFTNGCAVGAGGSGAGTFLALVAIVTGGTLLARRQRARHPQ